MPTSEPPPPKREAFRLQIAVATVVCFGALVAMAIGGILLQREWEPNRGQPVFSGSPFDVAIQTLLYREDLWTRTVQGAGMVVAGLLAFASAFFWWREKWRVALTTTCVAPLLFFAILPLSQPIVQLVFGGPAVELASRQFTSTTTSAQSSVQPDPYFVQPIPPSNPGNSRP
jgi:hypothetical protein